LPYVIEKHDLEMKKNVVLLLNMIVLVAALFSCGNPKPAAAVDNKESVRAFTQKFYDGYVAQYNKPLASDTSSCNCGDIKTLKEKPSDFDPKLLKAIVDDSNAQAKVAGDIVGLDFDPFLASQDNGFGYQAGNVKQIGDKFWVEMHIGEINKPKSEILSGEVHVIVEVAKNNGYWVFTNFIYPAEGKTPQTDLLQILKDLKKDREQPAK